MRIAYTGWTWLVNHQDQYRFEFEQFLKAMRDLGYGAAENFAFIKGYFDGDASAVRALLDRYGVELANLYLHYSDDDEADYRAAVEYVDFMEKVGATHMNLQGTMWRDQPFSRPTDAQRVLGYATLSNRIGRLCESKGMKACFHPHMNTPVFTREQIELLLSNTDPRYVWLCLDTAHTVLAGMDPVEAVRRFGSRIGYMHLKDIDPDPNASPEWPMNRFLPLGMGTVDFKGIYKALRGFGYDGVLCVELDNPPVCNYHAAMVSRQYLHNAIGL